MRTINRLDAHIWDVTAGTLRKQIYSRTGKYTRDPSRDPQGTLHSRGTCPIHPLNVYLISKSSFLRIEKYWSDKALLGTVVNRIFHFINGASHDIMSAVTSVCLFVFHSLVIPFNLFQPFNYFCSYLIVNWWNVYLFCSGNFPSYVKRSDWNIHPSTIHCRLNVV